MDLFEQFGSLQQFPGKDAVEVIPGDILVVVAELESRSVVFG